MSGGRTHDNGDPGHVLVVDDNAANRYLLAGWLRMAGHRVDEAVDGAAALSLLAEADTLPEIAVLDIVLPDMSGFELCQRIKDGAKTTDMPVIHVSATAISVADRTQGLHGGADAYLTEPVDRDEVLATITAVLRYTRARRAAQHLAARLMRLNEATLELHRATDFEHFAMAAVDGTLDVLELEAASVYLSLSGRPFRTHRLGAQLPLVSERMRPEVLERISSAVLGAHTGAKIALMSQQEWRRLVPGPAWIGDVLVAAVRAHAARPPVCVAVAVQHPPSADDRTLLMQMAQACALSLESLRNYAEEHELALVLQRSFLPSRLPTVPGVDLAVRYVPASMQVEVGGDFYEAIQTPAGLLLAIGDVVGHSIEAAILMAEMRYALRAYTLEGHPPEAVLGLLDTLLARSHPELVTATVCLVLVDPDRRRLHVANAGHIPPLLTDGRKTWFVTEHGRVLGIGGARYSAATVELDGPAKLVLCTDGLIEVRGVGLDERLAALETAVAESSGGLEELCGGLLDSFGQGNDDDIALLAAYVVPETAPDAWSEPPAATQ